MYVCYVCVWYAHWCVIVQLDDEDKVACRRLNPIHLIQLGDAMLHSSARHTQLY
jgi:hypothetical protein